MKQIVKHHRVSMTKGCNSWSSVAVVLGLERARWFDTEVLGLLVGEFRQPHTQRVEVERSDTLIEMLRQHVNTKCDTSRDD